MLGSGVGEERLPKKLGSRWSALSRGQKSALIVAGVSVIVAAVLFSHWLGRVNYRPLYTGLEAQQASAVVNKLQESNVPYKLADQGSTILVPEDQVYQLRLVMAGSGLQVTGGKGFELFDDNRLGVTEFERRIDYQRALQEELRRTIVQMDEVEQARVHLVLPQESIFLDQERHASAAVTLKLNPLARLNPEQVKSIIYLLSGSVENLPPENVKVINTNGEILSQMVSLGGEDTFGSQQSLEQLKLQQEFEKSLESRIQQMLERIIGPGKAVAMVSANLDFNRREVTRIEYGDEGVVRSEEVSETQENTTGGLAGMQAGEVGPPVYATTDEGMSSESTSTKTIRNYEIDETQEKTLFAPGRLESISTSVAVDGPLNEEEVNQIREIVSAATGYQEGRDQISVISMAFDRSYIEETEEAMEAAAQRQQREERLKRYITWGLQALGLILVLVLGLFFIRWLKKVSRAELENGKEAAQMDMAAVEEFKPELSSGEQKRRDIQEKVREKAQKKPEETAQLIKTWLAED